MIQQRFLIGCLGLVLLTSSAPVAFADFQATGRFLYTDREFALGGFTGVEPNLPIREADVEVVDAGTQLVLATGVTDNSGNFSISVVDNQTRDIIVRALTSSDNTPNLHMRVVNQSSAIYAVAHTTFFNHAPTSNINFSGSPVVAVPSTTGNPQPGDPFNVFDVTLDALNFVASENGSRPGIGDLLTLRWYLNSGDGTYYSDPNATVALLGLSSDSDGYDDSVIQHEVGHYVEFRLADSDNPGGFHQLDMCYPQTLSWSEGWSTFFQNMVRNWRGFARPDIYVDTSGQPGPGGAFISYSVESITFPSLDAGSGNEASVNASLWDIVDTPATLDATPGVDDDAINLADGSSRFWDVHQNYIPTVARIQIEKFWDGWFVRGHGQATAMQDAFTVYKMQFFDDAFESDDTFQQARNGGITNDTTQHTLYPVDDEDWTKFDGVAGGSYSFTLTTPLACGVSTTLSLFDSNGTSLLSTNPTTINWVASKNAALYLRVMRPGPDAYGNYELTVDITVPVVISDVQLTAVEGGGVALAWHAEQTGAFSHFNIERSDHLEGPYAVLNSTPIADASNGDFQYVDATVEPGVTWFYRILGVEEDGEVEAFGPYEITLQSIVPAHLALHPARPNPFNPNTKLSFDLPRTGAVFVRVYAVNGRLVRTLVAGQQMQAGTQEITWNGRDNEQRPLASGIYIVRLDAQGRSATQRAVLIR